MKRILTICLAMATIVGAFAACTAGAYLLGGLVEAHWFQGASHLTNLVILMLVMVMVIATLLTLAERKWSALMQDRIGPDRARIALPFLKNRSLAGIPHIGADVLKMLFKEDFIPAKANRLMFELGPVLAFAPAFALFAVLPAGPAIPVGDQVVDMVVTKPDFGILYLFAIASLAVYGTSLAGWASNNKFALLGAVRAASQMISYEVALGLSLVGIMMAFSSVSPGAIVEGQFAYLWRLGDGAFDIGLPAWGIFLQPIGFFNFFAASFAETKRAPFDVPEGESEIIGYFVEYSGMKFGLFMIAEFVEVVVVAAVLTLLFLGGWHLPFGGEWLKAQLVDAPLLYGTLLGTVFWVKVLILCYVQLAIRWTFPRFRYDQIQTLGWKILLPISLVNVFVSGALVLWDPSLRALALFGLLVLGTLLALTLSGKKQKAASLAPAENHGHSAHAAVAAHH